MTLVCYCAFTVVQQLNWPFLFRRTSSTSARLPALATRRLQLLSRGIPGTCRSRYLIASTAQIFTTTSFVLVNRPDTNSSFFWQLDLGIPAMTTCCNQLDVCYETCGTDKYDCDSEFRSCLHGICSDINKSLGFASKVQGGFKYLACPLFLAVYQGMVKTYEHQKRLTYSLLFLTPLCISLSFLLSLWIDGRHSLQHSVDSWM